MQLLALFIGIAFAAPVAQVDENAVVDRFIKAAESGNVNQLARLQEQFQISVSARDNEALIRAAHHDRSDAIQYLLDNNADIHTRNDEALKRAVFRQNMNAIDTLLANGADPNARPLGTLIFAVQSRSKKVVHKLIDFPDFDVDASKGVAMQMAIELDRLDLLSLIMTRNPRIDFNDYRIIRIAADKIIPRALKILFSQGRKIEDVAVARSLLNHTKYSKAVLKILRNATVHLNLQENTEQEQQIAVVQSGSGVKGWIDRARRSKYSTAAVVSLAMLTDSMAYGIPMASINDHLMQLGLPTVYSGYLIGGFAASIAATSPVFGYLTDRYTKQQALLIFGLMGLLAANFLFAYGKTFAELLVSRLVQGVSTAATFTVGLGMIATQFRSEDEFARAIAMVLMTNIIGSIVSPPLGGKLYEIDPKLPYFVCSGLALLDLVGRLMLILPPPLPENARMHVGMPWEMLKKPFVLLCCFNAAAITLSQTSTLIL